MFRYYQLLVTALVYVTVVSHDLFAQRVLSLSVEEAVHLALENNTDVAIALANTARAEYGVRESKGNFLPKLNLIGSYTRNIDKPVIFLPESFGFGGATEIGSDNNFSTYLDLAVPLYSKYNLTARSYAQNYFLLQRENLNGAQLTVVANVKKAYFACVLAIEAVKVREKALANAEQNYSNSVHRLAMGIATEYDETAARVRVANFRNDLLDARNKVVPARNTLELLLGLSSETVVDLVDSLYLNEEELALFPNVIDLSNNSNLRQNELRIQVTRQETAMTSSSYFPVLSGTGTYQYQSQQNDLRFSDYDWVLSSSLGLRLQVPIFNGTVTRNRIQQSLINERIAKEQMEYTARYNDTQFELLTSRLGYLKQRMDMQAETIELAAKAIELITQRYQYGRASLLEVNSAELDYVSAKLNYLQSIADYKSAYCDLELLTGK